MTDIETLIRLETDKAALNRTLSSIEDVRDELTRLNRTGKSAGGDSASGMKKLAAEASKAQAEIDDLNAALKRTGEAGKDAGNSKISGAELADRTGSTASQLLSGLGAGDAANAAGILGDVGGALSSLTPVGLALSAATVGVGLAMGELSRAMAETAKGSRALIASQEEYYTLTLTASSESVQEAIDAKEQELEIARARYAEYNAVIEQSYAEASETLGIFTGALIQITDAGGELRRERDAVAAQIGEQEYALGRLQTALEDGTLAAADAAEAERVLAEERTKALLDSAQNVFNTISENERLLGGSSQAAEQAADAYRIQEQAALAAIAVLQASGDTSDEATAQLEAYNDQLVRARAQQQQITDTLLPQIRAREEEEAAIKAAQDALAKFNDEAKKTGGTKSGNQLASSADLAKQRADLADAVRGYNTDIAKINSDFYERRADMEREYGDKQVEIAQQAADDAAQALTDLQETRAEAADDFKRGELDAQIKAQEDEAKALRDHQRNLEDIRKKSADQEFELALNRDFRGLFQSRRQTNRDLENATSSFTEGRGERAKQQEQERSERLAAYQQTLADAQAQYAKEVALAETTRQKQLSTAQQAYSRELSQLQQKHALELTSRQQAIQAELQLISQGAQQRVQIESQAQAALVAQAMSMLGSLNGAVAQAKAAVTTYSTKNSTMNVTQNISGGSASAQQIAGIVNKQLVQFGRAAFGLQGNK